MIAAVARADQERLEQYAAAADRLLRVEFSYLERHLAWLHKQCSGDWIFRIDADEVASPSLVERLPELIADCGVQQYWLPRRWLYPEAGYWLEEVPWWPDYQNRLVRNDGTLRFSGLLHSSAEPTHPARYVEEPLYHLACLTDDVAARRSRAIKYEVLRPGLEAPGGGSLNRRAYLPELYARRPPASISEEDAEAVRAVMSAGAVPQRPVGDVPVVPLAESDRHWGGRTVEAGAYKAVIEPFELEPRLKVGELRPIHMRVTNRGTDTWPWDAEAGPTIRCAYRWLHANGTVLVPEGHRTSFTCDVPAGATVVVPLLVEAPSRAGVYLLEVDLVHEHIRWFGEERRIRRDEERRRSSSLYRPGSRRRSAQAPEIQRIRRRAADARIPQVVHRVWLGGHKMPRELVEYGQTWRQHHPGWKFRLWRDRDLRRLVPSDAVARARHHVELSDLLRFEVLRRYGGVYVDGLRASGEAASGPGRDVLLLRTGRDGRRGRTRAAREVLDGVHWTSQRGALANQRGKGWRELVWGTATRDADEPGRFSRRVDLLRQAAASG